MPASQLSFQGINRSVSDYSSTGACEELINLRPTTAGLEPVKPFSVQMNAVSYDRVYEHKTSTGTNYIALRLSDSTLSALWISENGSSVIATLFDDVSCSSIEDAHVAMVGNILLFSIKDSLETRSFLWGDGEYKTQESNVPELSVNVNISTPEIRSYEVSASALPSTTSKPEFINAISPLINAIEEQNPDYCFGRAIVAIAFKTKDGDIFWTNKWLVVNPIPKINAASLKHPLSNDNFYQNGGGTASAQSYCVLAVSSTLSGQAMAALGGSKVSIDISQLGSGAWDPDTSILKSVEIYASRPKVYLDYDNYLYGTYSPSASYLEIFFGPNSLHSINLGDELLYHQGSIQLDDLMLGDKSLSLSFGGNIQTASETLNVDAGPVTRYGEILAYNARFHYYNSIARNELAMPSFNENPSGISRAWHVFIHIKDSSVDDLYYVGSKTLKSTINLAPLDIHPNIYSVTTPFRNVSEVVLYTHYNIGEDYYRVARYPMTASTRYNYSIFDSGPSLTESYTEQQALQFEALISRGVIDHFTADENMSINVTEQYNPFIFKVDHSYLAPGKVLGLYPQMVAVTDVSYGDYPLNVFTDRGTYALLQGNGAVLYGAFRPISNLVSTSNGIPTESGTFFLAAGGLWLIAGSHAVLISDALSRGPHKYIRSCAGYQQICNGQYDISELESDPTFEEFTQGASLVYNRFRDELIISNPSYSYSYVLSLKYRQWFKVAYRLYQDAWGSLARQTQDNASVTFIIPSAGTGEAVLLYVFSSRGSEGDIDFNVTSEESGNPLLIAKKAAEMWNEYSTIKDYVHATYGTGASGPFLTLSIVQPYDYVLTRAHYYSDAAGGTDMYFPLPGIVNFSDEVEGTDILVHLQSRPFSYGYQYSHIHRLVSMIRANLSSNDHLFVALYGSDNLQDWSLLSYADRTNTKVSQIRTAPSSRSWRYYTITIGGTAPQETDFGPSIIDYEPVIRRIG